MNKKTTKNAAVATNKKISFLLISGCLFLGLAATAQTTFYVKPEAAGTGDGTSWENASGDLQLAINTAVSEDVIWVAAGTYKPNRKATATDVITVSDRDNAFVLKDGVAVYGGFAGTETALEERDLTKNTSILSGDFNDDDVITGSGSTLSITNNTENAYHVVLSVQSTADPAAEGMLDGFTITGGNAQDAAFGSITINDQSIARYNGGGISNNNSIKRKFTNLTITANSATNGAGVYNNGAGALSFLTVTISNNAAASTGGGMANWAGASPIITSAAISGNSAISGGGMYNYNNSLPVVATTTITQNVAATGGGGGIYNYGAALSISASAISQNSAATFGGGIYNTKGDTESQLSDVAIAQNTAPEGGGIYNESASPVLTEVNFTENTATTGKGGAMYNYDGASPALTAVIFANNTAVTYGGGIANWSNCSPVITTAQFTGNTANIGGGIVNNISSSPVLTNIILKQNTAAANGGGIANYTNSSPVITNTLIVENKAVNGAGLYNQDNAVPILTNVTVTANTASSGGGGVNNNASGPDFRNSILYGNIAPVGANLFNYGASVPQYAYSLIQGSTGNWASFGTDKGGNIDADPLFDTGYVMQLKSPAVNKGSNSYFAAGLTPNLAGITTDLAGKPRFYNNHTIDMGAYETQEELGLANFSAVTVRCYPNPAGNELSIDSAELITHISVYNLLGQPVLDKAWNANYCKLDITALQSAHYIVKVTANDSVSNLLISKK